MKIRVTKNMITFNMRASLFTPPTPLYIAQNHTVPSSAVFTHLSELFQADSTKFVLNLVPEISELHRGLMSSENGKSWKSMRKASLGSLGLRLTTLLPLPRKSRWNQTISPFEKDNPPSRPSFLGSMVGLGSVLVHMMFDYSFLSHTYISTNLYYFTNLSQRFWGGFLYSATKSIVVNS